MSASRLALVVLLAACNGATSSVTLGNHALAPRSAVFTEAGGIATVLITDVNDYCRELVEAAPETPSCNLPPSPPYRPEGLFFTLRLSTPVAGDTFPAGRGLDATFGTHISGTLFDFFTRANAGAAVLETYEAGKSISGTYDLTFPRDGQRTGTFRAEACDVSRVVEATRKSRTCLTGDGFDAGIDACSRSCSCERWSAATSCSFNSQAGNWTCLCTGPDWQQSTTTCVMQTRPDCNTEVGTCCSLVLPDL